MMEIESTSTFCPKDVKHKQMAAAVDVLSEMCTRRSSSDLDISSSSTLKRSSSAPTGLNFADLNLNPCLSTSCLSSNITSTAPSPSSFRCTELSLPTNAHRRNSSVCDGRLSAITPDSTKKFARRLYHLRQEGNLRMCIDSDYAGERYFRSAAQISSTWSDFQIEDLPPIQVVEERKRAKSVCEPVHILTNFLPASCSPSPTRNEKVRSSDLSENGRSIQCYSPSMQQVVRKACFSPSPSPSPTRRSFLRSLSPIAVRQTCFKRKYDSDNENNGSPSYPAKRATYTPPVPMQVDRSESNKLIPSTVVNAYFPPLVNHSLSISSLDSESSSCSTVYSDFATISDRSSVCSLAAPSTMEAYFNNRRQSSRIVECSDPSPSSDDAPAFPLMDAS